jgi:hypothetical protein
MDSSNSFLSSLNRLRCEKAILKRWFLCSSIRHFGTQHAYVAVPEFFMDSVVYSSDGQLHCSG